MPIALLAIKPMGREFPVSTPFGNDG